MPAKIETIGFDADDTLWQNEQFFKLTQERFADLLSDHADPDHLADRLLEAERRNIGHYGFGAKGFILSMIETAIEVTEKRVPAAVVEEIMDAGREILSHPIELLPCVEDTVRLTAENHHLLLITKGDLLDQERKLAQSGLGDLFDGLHIVSDKTQATYVAAFGAAPGGTEGAMMVGNSLKSDVIPALEAGAWGVHVPNGEPWALDMADAPEAHPRFHAVADLGALPELLAALESG